jgi:hypothetical protein
VFGVWGGMAGEFLLQAESCGPVCVAGRFLLFSTEGGCPMGGSFQVSTLQGDGSGVVQCLCKK